MCVCVCVHVRGGGELGGRWGLRGGRERGEMHNSNIHITQCLP